MILHLVPENVDGCAYHRIQIPMHNLKGFDLAQSTVLDGVSDEDLKKVSVVVMNRDGCVFDVDKQISRLKRFNIPLVVDIDDFWELDKHHIIHKHYKDVVSYRIIKLLKAAAAVITTHSRLARKIDRYNKNVVVAPNALDKSQSQWEAVYNDHPSPRFGWVGGIHHIEDIRLLRPAFAKIHEEDKIHLALGGFTPNDVYMVFNSWFSNGGKYGKYKCINSQDVYNYGNIYNTLDVCLVPLIDTKFNNCKSNLKILEAGFKGKAVIVSRVAPYTDDFTDKEVLFTDDWYSSINILHENPQMTIDYRDALNERVKDFEIKKINIVREQLYTTLLNGK